MRWVPPHLSPTLCRVVSSFFPTRLLLILVVQFFKPYAPGNANQPAQSTCPKNSMLYNKKAPRAKGGRLPQTGQERHLEVDEVPANVIVLDTI